MYQAVSYKTPDAAGETVLVMTWNIKCDGGRIDFAQGCFDDRLVMEFTPKPMRLMGLCKNTLKYLKTN